MNRTILFVAVFLIAFALVLGGLWFFQGPNNSSSQPSDELTKINGDTEPGNVSVAVTLVTKDNSMEMGADEFDLSKKYVFLVEMNTHSVDITKVDMAKVSSIKADSKSLQAQWKQTMESVGHHRNGFLIFDKAANAKKFELVIKDIADVAERTFTWEL